ncbi:pyrroline-5-carboxylate reductase [Draconibacterium sp. IB214405]|uniref:pyrroline-5-carboxylate reductase n=1 Tax=Draconibacterium sp. IB214405 TaxID=3097352 RepID=UPI002A0DC213|nr:pyrroline-5-carboxylate reductase [Draconibacterium sp. IB214405]MDX8338424.1 pyrroline-5-carboxylate reductase [Draconibacterium sp. IB214405]
MENKKITIIGVGNMGGAIAVGLLKSGSVKASDISISDRKESTLKKMSDLGINAYDDNKEAAKDADIIIVAVKPYHIEGVINDLKPVLTPDKIFISIVAGVGIDELGEMAGNDLPIFRVMPNTAIALQESLTCISANANTEQHREYVVELFDKLGKTIEIPEELMAAATVLSSCGIAYALRYIRAAMQGGIEIGFSAEMAQLITAQTVKGATELLLQSGHHPEWEIDKVTTPMGVTITGLNEMEHKGFSSSLIQGVMASYKKIKDH